MLRCYRARVLMRFVDVDSMISRVEGYAKEGAEFGIIALTWPGITVLALALLFGAWVLLDGVSLLINVFRQGRAHADWQAWVPWLLAGLLGVATAVVTVLLPVITVVALTIVAAILLVGVGVAEIVLAVRLRKLIRGEVFMALARLAGIIAGVLFFIWPCPAHWYSPSCSAPTPSSRASCCWRQHGGCAAWLRPMTSLRLQGEHEA